MKVALLPNVFKKISVIILLSHLVYHKSLTLLTQENPMQAIAPLKISATIAGYELAVGK